MRRLPLLLLLLLSGAQAMSRAGMNATLSDLQNATKMIHNAGVTGSRTAALQGVGLRFWAQRCLNAADSRGAQMVATTEQRVLVSLGGNAAFKRGLALVRSGDVPALKARVNKPCRP